MRKDAVDGSGGTIPFWIHQLVEMLLAALLLLEGARSGQHTAVLVGLGIALLLLSLLSDGGLGAWRWIGRRTHRLLDFAFAATFAVTPLVLSLDRILAIAVIEASAAGLVWLALRTNWSRRERHRDVAPTSPPVVHPPPPPAAPLRARRLGTAVGRARAEGPHRLGRMVGRARSHRPHRPQDP